MKALKPFLHSFINTAVISTLVWAPMEMRYGRVHAQDTAVPAAPTGKNGEYDGSEPESWAYSGCGNIGEGGLTDAQIKQVTDEKAAAKKTAEDKQKNGQTLSEDDQAVLAEAPSTYNCSPTDSGKMEYLLFTFINMTLSTVTLECQNFANEITMTDKGIPSAPMDFKILAVPSLIIASAATWGYLIADYIAQTQYTQWSSDLQSKKIRFSNKYFKTGRVLEPGATEKSPLVVQDQQMLTYMKQLAQEKINRAVMINRRNNLKGFQTAMGFAAGMATLETVVRWAASAQALSGAAAIGTGKASIVTGTGMSVVPVPQVSAAGFQMIEAGKKVVDGGKELLKQTGFFTQFVDPVTEVGKSAVPFIGPWPGVGFPQNSTTDPINPYGKVKDRYGIFADVFCLGNGIKLGGLIDVAQTGISLGMQTSQLKDDKSFNFLPKFKKDQIIDKNKGNDFLKQFDVIKNAKNYSQILALLNEQQRLGEGKLNSISIDEYKIYTASEKDMGELSFNFSEVLGGLSQKIDGLKSELNLSVKIANADGDTPTAPAPKPDSFSMQSFLGLSDPVTVIRSAVTLIMGLASKQTDGVKNDNQHLNVDKQWIDFWEKIIQIFPIDQIYYSAETRATLFWLYVVWIGNIIGPDSSCGSAPITKTIDASFSDEGIAKAGENSIFMQGTLKYKIDTDGFMTCAGDGAVDGEKAASINRIRIAHQNELVIEEYLKTLNKMAGNTSFAVNQAVDEGLEKSNYTTRNMLNGVELPSVYSPEAPMPLVFKAVDPLKTSAPNVPTKYQPFTNMAQQYSTRVAGYTKPTIAADVNSSSNYAANAMKALREARRPYEQKILAAKPNFMNDLKAKVMAANNKAVAAYNQFAAAKGGDANVTTPAFGTVGLAKAIGAAATAIPSSLASKPSSNTNRPSSKPSTPSKGSSHHSSNDHADEGHAKEKPTQKTIAQALDEYDVGDTDVNKNGKASIWQILSNRYLKSYPKVLEEVNTNVQPPLKLEESKKP